MSQITFSIIKPDGVRQGDAGKILAKLEGAGFKIRGLRMIQMTQRHAEGFYAVHKERPFFGSLTEFMSSGPCVPAVLEREDAISHLRKVMGATNPADAEEGTIRKQWATDIGQNAIHGSDAPETAAEEIGYFFSGVELPSAG